MTKETPGRQYDRKEFIDDALGKVEVKLDDKDEEARAKPRMEQAWSEDEGTMAAIIDKMFDNANQPADADNSNTRIDMTFNSGSDFVVNGGINQGRVTNEDDNGDLDYANINNDENNVDDHENDKLDENDDGRNAEFINGATRIKVKCRLANVNELCFVNIRAKGRELLERQILLLQDLARVNKMNKWVNSTNKFMTNVLLETEMIWSKMHLTDFEIG